MMMIHLSQELPLPVLFSSPLTYYPLLHVRCMFESLNNGSTSFTRYFHLLLSQYPIWGYWERWKFWSNKNEKEKWRFSSCHRG